MSMKKRLAWMLSSLAVAMAAAALIGFFSSTRAADPKPIKALLITGGCCHDYPYQTEKLTAYSKQSAGIAWTVVNEGGRGTKAKIKLYDDPKWAEPYDVVVHNECFANTKDPAYIRKILAAHKAGKPAVVIHCAMHTYRAAKIDDWREFLGVTSKHHEHQSRYPVKVTAPDHPILTNFPKEGWTTPKDELYVVTKVWPNTKILATSRSERTKKDHAVFWTNTYGKGRVFGTTYGHSKGTFADPVFLETVTRGALWAAGRLD